jgi:hypothetical protein
MTLLQLVTTFCQRTGLTVPTFVAGNSDAQIIQILALLNEVLEDVVDRADEVWTALNKEATFTSVAAESQGLLTTLAPYGYIGILNNTIYDRTQRLPSYGPLSPQDWQALKALPQGGPYYKYRIWEGQLFLYPAPPAGHTYAFEYSSTYAVSGPTSTFDVTPTSRAYFTMDADTCLLDERVVLRGLRWKWKKEKGLDYDEDFREYEALVTNALGRDGTKATLYQDSGAKRPVAPGIFVPSGSWPV